MIVISHPQFQFCLESSWDCLPQRLSYYRIVSSLASSGFVRRSFISRHWIAFCLQPSGDAFAAHINKSTSRCLENEVFISCTRKHYGLMDVLWDAGIRAYIVKILSFETIFKTKFVKSRAAQDVWPMIVLPQIFQENLKKLWSFAFDFENNMRHMFLYPCVPNFQWPFMIAA